MRAKIMTICMTLFLLKKNESKRWVQFCKK